MEEIQIPSPAAVSQFRASRVLDAIGERISKGRLDLYYELLNEVHDTTDLDLSDIAAALLAQAVGDDGPKPWNEKDRRGKGKIRREEELDESGEFVGASFEGGRLQERGAKSGKDSARRRPARTGTGRRYRIEVGKKDRVKPSAIVGAITGEGGLNVLPGGDPHGYFPLGYGAYCEGSRVGSCSADPRRSGTRCPLGCGCGAGVSA